MSEHQDNSRDNRSEYRQDTVLEHEFDGIQEFDNRLPNWWLWLMWGSMVFALFYWLVFHTLELRETPQEHFETVMVAAQEAELARMAASGVNDETLLMMSEMSNKVTEGRALFVAHCVACHLDQGQGSVGPNLTDNVWIHGCRPMDMMKTVTDGVPAKGMPAWMNQLGPSRVQTVLAYVLTLKDTNVPGKAPEGEPCVE
jgi:cytochrome c oxidase cbb3-type subunit III